MISLNQYFNIHFPKVERHFLVKHQHNCQVQEHDMDEMSLTHTQFMFEPCCFDNLHTN